MSGKLRMSSLLQSGLIFSAVNFITGLGNLAFQGVMGRHLGDQGQYGNANSALGGFMPLLGLLPCVATLAVTHYIAHYQACGDHARLQGLLAGSRKFLFRFTVVGSLLALAAVKPLSDFFHFSQSLMLVSLGCTLFGLWGSYATVLCQGFGWFKRLALIGLLGMALRFGFGWFVTIKWPSAETAVLATGFALLANLALLCWRKDLVIRSAPVSPWNREFVLYFVISAACVGGSYCFFQGDLLVAKKYFSGKDLDAYTAAGQLARALPMTVGPMLTVLFTSRSSQRAGGIVAEQLKLMGIYAAGLLAGAAGLFVLRGFCVKLIFGHALPAAEAMIVQLSITMVFVGLLQALAQWALASRWTRLSLLYGALGIAYWLVLLALGRTPASLLPVMAGATGIALVILLAGWLIMMWRHKPVPQS